MMAYKRVKILTIVLARVTYHDGFKGANQPSATVQADKSRTIGHYVVGKYRNIKGLKLLRCVGKSLGQGTFGKVRIGTHTITNEMVAIKILEKDKIKDKADVERVTREINILKKVRHPNVIQLYEVSSIFWVIAHNRCRLLKRVGSSS